jgi:hypothetical protein
MNQSPMENPNGVIWPVPYAGGSRDLAKIGLHYAPSEVGIYLVHMNLIIIQQLWQIFIEVDLVCRIITTNLFHMSFKQT